MLVPVVDIWFGQVFGFNDQNVFSVPLLRSPGEVKGPGYHRLSVYDHDLVMGDGMGRINIGRNSHISQEGSRCVFLGSLALVHNGFNFDSPLVGIKAGLWL